MKKALLVILAVVVIGFVAVMGYGQLKLNELADKAVRVQIRSSIKMLQDGTYLYAIENDVWPVEDKVYKSEEIMEMSDLIFGFGGEVETIEDVEYKIVDVEAASEEIPNGKVATRYGREETEVKFVMVATGDQQGKVYAIWDPK